MTLKSYLWGMRIAAFFSFIALTLVIWYVDPEKSGLFGSALLFASLFFLFSSVSILFFSWMRRHVATGEEHALAYMGVSFRQGVLVAVLAVLMLLMQQLRILVWWDGALAAAGVLLLELHFLTRRQA